MIFCLLCLSYPAALEGHTLLVTPTSLTLGFSRARPKEGPSPQATLYSEDSCQENPGVPGPGWLWGNSKLLNSRKQLWMVTS